MDPRSKLALRKEHLVISDWVKPKSRLLDLGCGDGALLAHLTQSRQVKGYGLEIDLENVNTAISRGVSVIQADLEGGLDDFEDFSVDTVILSQVLQSLHNTEKTVDEILRVGKEAIVSFPNFGYWRVRGYLYFRGRMPVSKRLPHEWYNTPNVHLFTVRDFHQLCSDKNIEVVDTYFQTGKQQNSALLRAKPNLLAELAVFRIRKKQ